MMKSLLYSIFAASVIVINGCANIVKNKKPDDAVNTLTSKGLPAQELASGECGIFLWDNAVPRSFIFFQKQGQETAKYYSQGVANTLQIKKKNPVMAGNGIFVYTYSNAEFEVVTLKGTFAEELEDGQRISSATIRIKKTDSWEEIIPVTGVYVCR